MVVAVVDVVVIVDVVVDEVVALKSESCDVWPKVN